MQDQIKVQKLLRKKLSELQARNPSYSVRAFSQKLGLQPAATNEIIKGERRVSRKMAERITTKLLLDPTEKNEILKHFPERRRLAKDAQADSVGEDYLRLTADQFQIISEWVHFAILSLIKTSDFKSDPNWIADRLGVTENRVKVALERLTRLELIQTSPEGVITRTAERLHTSDDVLNTSIQKSHIDDMELAKASLSNDPVHLRDFTSMTMPTSPVLLPKAKEIIRKARDELADLLSSEPTSEVYRFTAYLFPLTRVGKKK